MNPAERTLRTMGSLLKFEMATAMNKVASAVELATEAQFRLDAFGQRRDGAARDLREALHRATVNPALLETMRRLYEGELRSCALWESRLGAARQREVLARSELTQLRNRDRLVERGLKEERSKQAQRQLAADYLAVDELWSQHVAGTAP